MELTEEQRQVVESKSNSLKVIAFAGAGKTSTLRAYAEARPKKRLLYLAFNRSIREEATSKFPSNVTCMTTHAMAFRSIGKDYKHKLRINIRPNQIAELLDLNPQALPDLNHAAFARKALIHFLATPCLSFKDFSTTFKTHSKPILQSAEKLWEAMIDPKNNDIPMLHDGYLKLYQLSYPTLNHDGILFDEAQDANPVTLAIIRAQSMDIIYVGDPHQQIYQFRHVENAMDDPSISDTLYLTESFRFERNIAAAANALLKVKRETKSVKGGRRLPQSRSYGFLARGNAAIFTKAVNMTKRGRPIFFVGGIDGYRLELLLDIWRLRAKEKYDIKDPFIRRFEDYDALQEYAEAQDERDLNSWINVINSHLNWTKIPSEVGMIRQAAADQPDDSIIALSTAHKSKGLEFGTVELAEDFPGAGFINEPSTSDRKNGYPDNWRYGPKTCPALWDGNQFKGGIVFPEEELNLRYVAITRSEGGLVAEQWGVPPFTELSQYIFTYPDFVLANSEGELHARKDDTQHLEQAQDVRNKENDLSGKEEIRTGRLSDLVYAEYGMHVEFTQPRFNSNGWFEIGSTEAKCPDCGSGAMPGYRKPYYTSRGDKYHYWALVCLDCKKVYAPADLDPDSKKLLNKLAIPVESRT